MMLMGMPPRYIIPESELRRLYIDENKTIAEMSVILSVSKGTVYLRLKKLGIDTNSAKKALSRYSAFVTIQCSECGKDIQRIRSRSTIENPVCGPECYSKSKSRINKGENNPFYGHHFTKEQSKTLSRSLKPYVDKRRGKKLPEEWKKNISIGRLSALGRTEPKYDTDRTSNEYKIFVKAVFVRDNYTCKKCGKRGGDLNAHHLKNYSSYPKLRYLPINGVVLCKKCHKLFHAIYKRKDNTVHQYLEFLREGELGESFRSVAST